MCITEYDEARTMEMFKEEFNEKPSRNLPTLVGRGMRISCHVLSNSHFVY